MSGFIIFMVFAAILYVSVAGGVGLWFASEKGYNIWLAFIVCTIFPIVAHAVYATAKADDKVIVKEMYDRHLLSLKDYRTLEATLETKVKH